MDLHHLLADGRFVERNPSPKIVVGCCQDLGKVVVGVVEIVAESLVEEVAALISIDYRIRRPKKYNYNYKQKRQWVQNMYSSSEAEFIG